MSLFTAKRLFHSVPDVLGVAAQEMDDILLGKPEQWKSNALPELSALGDQGT